MKRAVVCVATTKRYQRGMARLSEALKVHGNCAQTMWSHLGLDWPSHEDKPYAFKAYAMKEACDGGGGNEVDRLHRNFDCVIWADACILTIRSMEPLWEKIEREGYWISNNGWMNSQWCADSWYEDCFPGGALEAARKINSQVPHVVATSFGLNLKHPIGSWILAEYYRLASNTRAFCGPWVNARKGIAGNPPADVPLPRLPPVPFVCGALPSAAIVPIAVVDPADPP